MTEGGDALRSCMEQMVLAREEKERLVIEATYTISSEQKKTRHLQQKLEDANKRFDQVIDDNCNLRKAVDSKEKLIKELEESKAYLDQKLTDATARVEFSQKQRASLEYEVRMLQEELAIRNKEREYDLKSIDAAQKQQQESMKKITALEAECQRLRTMVQKRLPGPAALAKMKAEVKRRSTSSVEKGMGRPCSVEKQQLRGRQFVSEDCLVKLQELGDENRHLRQLLSEKESDMQFLQLKYVDESCKVSVLQTQLEELSGRYDLKESNHSEPMVSALATKLEHSRSGKERVSQSRSRRITESDMQLLVGSLEAQKLEMVSMPSSDPHQYQSVPNVAHTVSEMVFTDKYPRWIQDVLKVIITSKHEVSKMNISDILDELTHALMSEISAKGAGAANLFYGRPEINKIVATLLERVRCMTEKSTQNNATSFRSFLVEKSELVSRLEHLINVCNDIMDGKADFQRIIDEVCLILEWMVNQCLLYLDASNSDGNKFLITIYNENHARQGANSEMVDSYQESHSIYCKAESAASDWSKEELAEDVKQLVTTSAISSAAKELAECRKTIANLSKRLDALQSPSNASDKEDCGTLPLPIANLVTEADTEPEDLTSSTSEEAIHKKENSKTDKHEQSSDTSPKADQSGPTSVVARPMVPKSPRKFVSVDAKKKKRRASFLSRLVFRKKA